MLMVDIIENKKNAVLVDESQYIDATEWCVRRLGPRWSRISRPIGNPTGVWVSYWAGPDNHNKNIFHFLSHEDATVFLLAWGSNAGNKL